MDIYGMYNNHPGSKCDGAYFKRYSLLIFNSAVTMEKYVIGTEYYTSTRRILYSNRVDLSFYPFIYQWGATL